MLGIAMDIVNLFSSLNLTYLFSFISWAKEWVAFILMFDPRHQPFKYCYITMHGDIHIFQALASCDISEISHLAEQ